MNRFLPSLKILLTLALMAVTFPASAQTPTPKKYALLVAVTTYEHTHLNQPPKIQYPEADATAIGAVLKASGYQVTLLMGEQATKAAIDQSLAQLAKQGNQPGVILIGLFGHGVEYDEVGTDGTPTSRSYFCPFDTTMRNRLGSDGKISYLAPDKPRIEPDPAGLVSISHIFSAMALSPAGNRVLLADCCRNDPHALRGAQRGFGTGVKSGDLPENANTAALFACSKGEQAMEDPISQHGAFTKCVLDWLADPMGGRTAGRLGEHLHVAVPKLVSDLTMGDLVQQPKFLNAGLVDLQLAAVTPPKPAPLPKPPTPPASGGREPSESAITNSINMKLTLIPSGEFQMGSSDADLDALLKLYPELKKEDFADEQPQHRVRITKPFYLGVHEVTKGQFAAFVKAKNYQTDAEKDGKGGYGFDGKKFEQKPEYIWKNAGFPQTDDHPVVNVSWNDAVAFCEWLSAKEGKTYRLPTEAEWEYACRAGTTTLWGMGNDPEGLASVGNVADGTAKAKINFKESITAEDGFVFTAPVGQFRANAFGLYDMHGNAWEWCQDVYDEKAYAGRSGVTSDPRVDTSAGVYRVLRGGSWNDYAWSTRSANRFRVTPDDRYSFTGFRVVRTQ